MITIDVTDETTGRNYTATIHADERVTIDCDGSRAGTGRLHQDRIVDCDAVIPEDVYAEIDAAIGPAIRAGLRAVKPMIEALRTEAREAADEDGVAMCDRALSGDLSAIETCGGWIAEAAANANA